MIDQCMVDSCTLACQGIRMASEEPDPKRRLQLLCDALDEVQEALNLTIAEVTNA